MLTKDALFCLLFSSAVRFGRIPKREKQRLLDEMQSYMNSLNESASLEMEASPPPDAPCSPQPQANDRPGSLPQPYGGSVMNGDEKPLKMAAGNSNASSFHNGPVQDPALSHATSGSHRLAQGEQTSYRVSTGCPVVHGSNQNSINANIDNSKYNYSSGQSQCPVSGSLSSQSYSANQNGFPAADSHNQTPCPWKLNGGAKVLVRSPFLTCLSLWLLLKWLSLETLNAGLSAGVSTQLMSCGSGQSFQSGSVGVLLPVLHPCC